MSIRAISPLRSTSAAVWVFLACAAVLVGCYFAVPERRAAWWALLGVAAVMAVLVGVRLHRPQDTAPWLLLAAALSAEMIGDLIYYFAGGQVGGRVPFPTPADALYLMVYPLAVASLLAFGRRDPPEYSAGTLLDVLIISTGLAAATWSVFVLPYSRLPEVTDLDRAILIAYLAGDAVLLALVLRLPLAGRLRSVPVALLLVGVIGLLASDALYGLAQLHSGRSTTPSADPVGDELLTGVARRLSNKVRAGDTVARLGGDEFAVVLGRSADAEHEAIARRLIEAFDEPFDTGAGPLRAAASAGLAVADRAGPRDPDLLLRNALLDHDYAETTASLHTFRELGASIALDDFGTGYAALSSLHSLPVDFVKIDKSFTGLLEGSVRMRNLVHGLISLASSLDIKCLAEGVETIEQHEILREMGCRVAQGYLYAPAMPAEQATALWNAKRPLLNHSARAASRRRNDGP